MAKNTSTKSRIPLTEEEKLIAQELKARKKEAKGEKKLKPKKEPKPKKEKVFRLKKDHEICNQCHGSGHYWEIMSVDGTESFNGPGEVAKCHICKGNGQFKIKKEKKPELSESEIVHRYARRVMDGKKSRGHVDDRFDETKAELTTNKELWKDQDFFCSLMFESQAQKYEFMEKMEQKFGFEFDEPFGHQIQIANGLKLADIWGITLKRETALPFPGPDLALLPLVLDQEAL